MPRNSLPLPPKTISLEVAIALAGSREALADLLDVTLDSTYRWTMNGGIPPSRLWMLLALRPDWPFRRTSKEMLAAEATRTKTRKKAAV